MKVSCPRCGKDNPDDIRFCLGCGSEIQARGAGARAGTPPKIAPPGVPPPLGMARVNNPAAPPIGAPSGGFPPIMGPPPLTPPVSSPVGAGAQSGPPVFGPLPPIGAPPGMNAPLANAPPSLSGSAPSFGLMPPIGSQGLGSQNLGSQGLGAPPIASPGAPPSLGPLPPIGSFGTKPPGSNAQQPVGPMGNLGPLPPMNPPVQSAPPQPGSLGPLPPLGGASAGTPSFSSSSPAISSGGLNAPPSMGMNAQPPRDLGGLGPLPPLGPQSPASGGLGALPPLGPQQPSRSPNGGANAAPFGQSPSGDPFSSGGDPFSSGGDPFAPAAPVAPYVPQGSDVYAAADPFAQSQSGSAPFVTPRAQTIGPNGLVLQGPPGATRAQTIGPSGSVSTPGFPPLVPAVSVGASPFVPVSGPGMPPAPQDQWSAPRIEPEIEESHTRVVSAIGTPRPKFLVTQLDGTEEGEFPLNDGENLIGREVGGMFSKDNLLSGRHATIIVQGQSVWVRDEGSRNGVYARIPRQQHVELNDGDQFCIGRIILRFEFVPAADSVGVLHLVVGRDVDKGMFPCRIPRSGVTLGRNRADLRFPLDGWVSGLHCQITPHGPQVMLVDLGSSNGTYLRIRGVRALAHHDALLMGQRIFHLHYG